MTIEEFFGENNKAAIAFSGGVDSSYMLYAAGAAGADVTAYYVKSSFQPSFELKDALDIAARLGVRMKILDADVLSDDKVRCNPEDRCYYCKQHIMSTILDAARGEGYSLICDGTNASDDVGCRPGWKALKEYGVVSPLRLCGLTKEDIRRRARDAGLPVWDKPAYACLATRIRQGDEITADKLERTEQAENALYEMGFRDFRVRMRGDTALVQVKEQQLDELFLRGDEVRNMIGHLYSSVDLDPQPRK